MDPVTVTLRAAQDTWDVTAGLPSGWSAQELPDGSVALVAPQRPGEFTPNVVLGLTVLPSGTDASVLLGSVRAARDQLPAVTLVGEEEREVGGRSWYVTEYAFTHDQAGTLAQGVRLARADGTAPVYVRSTATCAGTPDDPAAGLAALAAVQDAVTW